MDEKELLHGLIFGKRYILKNELMLECRLYTSGQHRYFTPSANLWLSVDDNGEYIEWQHYGSSAKELTAEALAWILKNIFKAKASDFIELPS